MLRFFQPVWLNTTITLYLSVFVLLVFLGFYWTAVAWVMIGASMIEDEYEEIEEEEEEQSEEELELLDLFLERKTERKNEASLGDFFMLEVFQKRLVEPFLEPDFALEEDTAVLYQNILALENDQFIGKRNIYVKELDKIIDSYDNICVDTDELNEFLILEMEGIIEQREIKFQKIKKKILAEIKRKQQRKARGYKN